MTEDFELELQERLDRMAAAVPVAGSGALVPVESPTMRAGATSRLAVGALVPVLAVAVLATLAAGLLRLGPFAPGASPVATIPERTPAGLATQSPTNGPTDDAAREPVVGRGTEGPFAIELRAPRRVYSESEVIGVTGAFMYSGDTPVEVQGLKLAYSIAEPVYGISVGDISTLECGHQVLRPGERLTSLFHQSGGLSGDDPLRGLKRAYLNEPVFTLPPGTWHLRYGASLFEGRCSTDTPKRTLSAEIEIVVVPADGAAVRIATASEPNPSPWNLCPTALGGGTLAPSPRSGLGFGADGEIRDVLWPFGYTARRDGDTVLLIDDHGTFVARTGEHMAVGGGAIGDNTFFACTVAPRATPSDSPAADASRSGGFELTISTAHKSYDAGERIDPLVRLVNLEHEPAPFVLASSPLVVVWIGEVGGAGGLPEPPRDADCGPFGYFEKDRPWEYRLSSVPAAVGWWPESTRSAYLEDAYLVLPSGTWTLHARSVLFDPTCDLDAATVLAPGITITVDP
jgi:hypothetical protein